MEKIFIKKIDESAITPSYAKEGDAGLDLFTNEEVVLAPKTTRAIKTGICFQLPKGYELQIRPRSGISLNGLNVDILTINDDLSVACEEGKEYVRVQLGTVDSGYRAEIAIITYNQSDKYIRIKKHTKLAQGVVNKVVEGILIPVENLTESERGEKGFGSTGV